jgi:hypothetical protein
MIRMSALCHKRIFARQAVLFDQTGNARPTLCCGSLGSSQASAVLGYRRDWQDKFE